MTYDLLIIGGGPGGVAAGVYAARKKIKTILITEGFGGQSLVSADIQNWIGTKSVSGIEFAKMMEEHLKAQEGIEILEGDLVEKVEASGNSFDAVTKSGKTIKSRYLLVASGSRRKKLGVPGEREYDGKGVVYCSTCDAPIFAGKTVAVVGGGNAGLEACVDLFPYAKKIYLIVRSESPKGDPVTLEKVKANENVEIITNALTEEIFGDEFVTGLTYKDENEELKRLDVQGVFVEIGSVPNSEFIKEFVKLNERGEVMVDHKTQQSSHEGIWAVGDVSDVLYKQNNISSGDAVKAVLNIYGRIVRD